MGTRVVVQHIKLLIGMLESHIREPAKVLTTLPLISSLQMCRRWPKYLEP